MPDDRPLTKGDLADALDVINQRFDRLERKVNAIEVVVLETNRAIKVAIPALNDRIGESERRLDALDGGSSDLPRAARHP